MLIRCFRIGGVRLRFWGLRGPLPPSAEEFHTPSPGGRSSSRPPRFAETPPRPRCTGRHGRHVQATIAETPHSGPSDFRTPRTKCTFSVQATMAELRSRGPPISERLTQYALFEFAHFRTLDFQNYGGGGGVWNSSAESPRSIGHHQIRPSTTI